MSAAAGFRYDFFVSRRGTVAAVAQEVADILEAEGFRVVVQDYDFASGGQFVLDIHAALKQARHLLILHSQDYDDSFWTQQEFANFLVAAAASGGERRIGVLRCDAAAPDGLLRGVTFGDLVGVDDAAERRRIVLAVANGETPQARPRPRIFGGTMPSENRLFTGRGDLLAALHAALSQEGGAAALTQAAVHGLGGVGKTSLARAYIARHEGDYAGIWWITAADRQGALAGLAGLAHALDPQLPAAMPTEDAAQAALDALAVRKTPFLLVYDNAPDPAALSGLLPKRGARVLITSRRPDWAAQAQELRVAAMPEDDAVALLQTRAGRTDEPGARRLARELGCLPLALDQAGAYAKQSMMSFDDYAARVEKLIDKAVKNPDYPASVAATFDLAITAAAKASPVAEQLLGLFAWFAPERIPLILLDDSIAGDIERAEGLAALINVSLVAPEPETAAGPAISLHRLVQAVVRHRLAAQHVGALARNLAVERLAAVFPGGAFRNPTVWPLCRALLPHLRALLARLAPGEETTTLADVLVRADNFLDGSGETAAAIIFSRRALEIYERVLGPDHQLTLTSLNNLASCLRSLGNFAEALALHQREFEQCERTLGAEHPDTLISMGNVALCMTQFGDNAGALPLHRRSLDTRERLLGPEHPQTLRSVANLAVCMRALGDASGALPFHRRALEGRQRVIGAEHPETLESVNNLAVCLHDLGDAKGALPLFRRALEGSERALGAEHPTTKLFRTNFDTCLKHISQ